MSEDTDQLIRNANQMLQDAAGVGDDALLAPNAATLADAAGYLAGKHAGIQGLDDKLRHYLQLAAGYAHEQGDLGASAGFLRRIADTHPPSSVEHRRALLDSGRLLFQAGRSADSLPVLRTLADLAKQAGDERMLYATWIQIAPVLSESGRPDQALELMQIVIGRSADDRTRGAAAVNAALAAMLVGRVKEATQYAELGIELNENAGDTPSALRGQQVLASLLTAAGEFGRAKSALRELARQAEAIGDERLLASALGNLCGVLLESGDIHGGRNAASRALDMFQRQGDEGSATNTCINLGVALVEEGYPEQAQRHFEHAIAHFERMGDAGRRANARLNLAQACLLLGQTAQARQAIQAEAECANSPETGLRCFWHAVSAELAAAEGNFEAARREIAQAMADSRQAGLYCEHARAAATAAKFEASQGQWQTALQHADSTIESLREAGPVPTLLQVDALALSARAARELGDRVTMKTRLIHALELADELPLLSKSEGPRAEALVAELRELQACM